MYSYINTIFSGGIIKMVKITEMLEESKRDLEDLIKICNGDLLDPFVIAASQKLDMIINEYNELVM